MPDKIKIIFFIESLRSGGKERRLIELLSYLKDKPEYELMVVLVEKKIYYKKFLDMKIPFVFIERKTIKKDPRPFFSFYGLCRQFKPDMVHVWGRMNAIYALPTIIFQKIPLINGQITSAPPNLKKISLFYWITRILFKFSHIILANSAAGVVQYSSPQNKTQVIYNGIDLNRFQIAAPKDVIRSRYKIRTPYSIAMVASFSNNKNYDLFLDVAKYLNLKRNDITMIAVGDGVNLLKIKNRAVGEQISNIVFTGRINDVEELISFIDIGVLFSNALVHGEGISNSILEYMALGKPVVANNTGGTCEIVKNGINGILVEDENPEIIADIIIKLIEDEKTRQKYGAAGKASIEKTFTIEKMGNAFERVYTEIYNTRKIVG